MYQRDHLFYKLLWSSHYDSAQNCVDFVAYLGQYGKKMWKKPKQGNIVFTWVLCWLYPNISSLRNVFGLQSYKKWRNTHWSEWTAQYLIFQKQLTEALLVEDKYHKLNVGKWITKRKKCPVCDLVG